MTDPNPFSESTSVKIFAMAIVIRGVVGAPFHIIESPQTNPIHAFHPKTAAGKLKAVMTPTIPRGFHVSIMKWPGRSEGRILPSRLRDSPQAKSQMSMISCISPSPSTLILPTSNDTRLPN